MIIFFIVAGLLLVGALLFVLPPLIGKRLRQGEVSHGETNLSIYRDQLRELDSDLANGTLDRTQYESAKREIERRVLEEAGGDEVAGVAGSTPLWTLAVGVAVSIPVVAITMYLLLGTPAALDPNKVGGQAQGGHDVSPQQIAKMVEDLQGRLRSNPDDVDGWVMLAKSTQALGRYDDSVKAYREIIRRVPPDAQLLADFADTLAVANGRSLAGEPAQLIEQALKVDPSNVKALALGGTIAFQQKDYSRAAQLWKKILDTVPPESDFAQRIQGSIAEAESLAGGGSRPVAARSAGDPVQQSPAGGVRVSGTVDLDRAVAKSVSPEATVFVFARAASGPKMPLAVLRLTARDLPRAFELTEAMAMAPGMSIAKFSDLVVGARISNTGSATPQPGDWESALVSARPGAQNVALTISRLVR